MNYKLHYEKLITKAQNRSILKSEYKEVHHIIPVCMNGSDDKENLIALFPEEHIVAHLLLTKIYPNNYGLLKASNCMTNGFNKCSRITNKKYAWLKKKYSERLSKEILDDPIHLRPGVKEKQSKHMKENNPLKLEHNRKKQSDRMKGDKNISKQSEVKLKISNGVKEWYKNNEHHNKGKKASSETKTKQSTSAKNRKSPNRKKLYHLISPNNDIFVCLGNLKKTTSDLNLSFSSLMINRGKCVPQPDLLRKQTDLRQNTTGWKLVEIG